jgi:hypothetical protein
VNAPAPSITASARALIERTTLPRGLSVRVEDPVVLSRLAVLLAPAAGRELVNGVGAAAEHARHDAEEAARVVA